MKTTYLFPNRLRMISGILFVVSFLCYLAYYIFDFNFDLKASVFAILSDEGFLKPAESYSLIKTYIFDEILMLIIIPSGVVYAFSKEKHEDEMVAAIRLDALAWATIANYGIILFLYMFIYGFPFLNVMMAALFSQLIIFITLLRYKMFRFRKSAGYEE